MQQVSILNQNNSDDDNDDKNVQFLLCLCRFLKQFLHCVYHATSRGRLFTTWFLFCNLDLFHSENEDYLAALFETPLSDGDPVMAQDAQ